MEEKKLRAELRALEEVLESLPKGSGSQEQSIKKRVAEITATLKLLETQELVGS